MSKGRSVSNIRADEPVAGPLHLTGFPGGRIHQRYPRPLAVKFAAANCGAGALVWLNGRSELVAGP